MELPHLGKHCGDNSCNQLDFLPFECEWCAGVYCKDHREGRVHKCEQWRAKQASQRSKYVMPQCPLCGEDVSLGAHGDANRAVSEHIDAGCSRKQRTDYRCQLKACTQRFAIPVICERCKRNFCLTHRHPADHQCTALPTVQPAALPTSAAPSSSVPAITAVQKERRRRRRRMRRLLEEKSKSGNRAAQRMQIIKQRRAAKGNKNIPQDARLYLEVVFPMRSKKKPLMMFFRLSWTVGRVLDEITDLENIVNRNDRPDAERLRIYDLFTGSRLDFSAPIRSLPAFAPILLEYDSGAYVKGNSSTTTSTASTSSSPSVTLTCSSPSSQCMIE